MKIPNLESPQQENILKGLDDTLYMVDQMNNKRSNMEDFHGVKYVDERQIEEDMVIVEKLGKIFKKDPERMSESELRNFETGIAAEYTLAHALEDAGWLGQKGKVSVGVASYYDDYVRGVDSTLQIETGEGRFEHFGLAIDFGTSKVDVGKKILKTLDSIDRGYSPSVRYFDSKKTGKLNEFKMPRVVIGASKENLDRLVSYSKEIINSSGVSEQVKKDLENDPFRYVMLGEMIDQLNFCITRLKRVLDEANAENDIKKIDRTSKAIELHENSLSNLRDVMDSLKITDADIQKHIRGDSYAHEIRLAIATITPLPIGFGLKK